MQARFCRAIAALVVIITTLVVWPQPALHSQTPNDGTVRVIVGLVLPVPFTHEGRLRAPDAALQRRAIAMAQSDVVNALASAGGVQEAKTFETIPFMAMRVTPAGLAALGALKTLVSTISVDDLSPVTLAESSVRVGAPQVWGAGFTGAGRRVAILDTGVDKNHPFLSGKVVSEACYSSTTSTSTSLCPGGVAQSTAAGSAADCSGVAGCGHGTHVAGIAAGKGSSFSGIARDAEIVAIKVFSVFTDSASCGGAAPCLRAYYSDQLLALDRVHALRTTGGFTTLDAVNLSLGAGHYTGTCDNTLQAHKAAIDNLRSVGVATIISAANDGYTDGLGAPACVSSAISVGSTRDGSGNGAADTVSPFSNSASFLSLLAPGEVITSSYPGGGFLGMSGTSMAAPHIAGAWALFRQAQPAASVDQILATLVNTGVPITDSRNGIVKRRVQIDAALSVCSFGLSPAQATVPPAGGAQQVTMTASAPACAWTATTSTPWITVNTPSGTGSGTLGYTVAINPSGGDRTGTIRIDAQDFVVTQLASLSADACTGATVIAAPSFSDTRTTSTATAGAGEPTPTCGGGSKNNSVWYRFTAPSTGLLTADTLGSNYDTTLSVYAGACDALEPAACNDDEQPGAKHSVVRVNATAGTTYLFMVTSFAAGGGTLRFNLSFQQGPTIASVYPASGPTAGGTPIEITGTGFTPGTSVTVGAAPATAVAVVSSTLLRATTAPSSSATAVPVVVSPPSQPSVTRAGGFTYLGAAQQTSTGDTDGDGMPDYWEIRFSLDPLTPDADRNPDADARTNLQEYQGDSHPRGLFRRFLAEGATGGFFDTRVAVLNPNAEQAAVLLTYLKSDGSRATAFQPLGALTRATIDPEVVLGTAEFSTVVEGDRPLVVDRTMTWDGSGYGSHADTAVDAPALTWYLAEGATHSGFDLFYLVMNPNAGAATVRITYFRSSGAPIVKSYTVPAASRRTIHVNAEDAGLAAAEVSAEIASTNNQPIIVERAMYLTRGGVMFLAGHESAGVTAPALEWFLAEGATGAFFDLYVLIANPAPAPASVTATYFLPSGATVVKTYYVDGNSRFTIGVEHEDPALADTAVSVKLSSTQPVIVERAMWWPGTPATWQEAHNGAGSTATGTLWAMADGELDGPRGAETYVLIANTSAFDATARVTLIFEDGTTAERSFPLRASSRFSLAMHHEFPSAAGRRFGTIVEALGAPAPQLVVERAMYSNAGSVIWAAGTNALAVRLR